MELIKSATTARELLELLKQVPDYMLDLPVILADDNDDFELTAFEAVDVISEGNRVQLIRLSRFEQ